MITKAPLRARRCGQGALTLGHPGVDARAGKGKREGDSSHLCPRNLPWGSPLGSPGHAGQWMGPGGQSLYFSPVLGGRGLGLHPERLFIFG